MLRCIWKKLALHMQWFDGNKGKERISKWVFQENKVCQIFWKTKIFYSLIRTHTCLSGGKKCSFYRKFGMLCFLETPVLRFTLLPYYWQIRGNTFNIYNRNSIWNNLLVVSLFDWVSYKNFSIKPLVLISSRSDFDNDFIGYLFINTMVILLPFLQYETFLLQWKQLLLINRNITHVILSS